MTDDEIKTFYKEFVEGSYAKWQRLFNGFESKYPAKDDHFCAMNGAGKLVECYRGSIESSTYYV